MSETNHYKTLGLDEHSSFEEIQSARDRLLKEHDGDRKQAEAVEVAYDAILMDRLRLRQEGKIKVPDRIRFPERPTEPSPPPLAVSTQNLPEWLQKFLDTPSQNEVLWPGVAFSGVAVLGLLTTPQSGAATAANLPTVALGLGTIFCVYFLNRKENRFLRSVLLTIGALVIGTALGGLLGGLVVGQLNSISEGLISQAGFDVLVTAFVFWIVSSFLR
ncbi:MAG: CPP1-like family protein [Leptolyngbyaceae bacterium]|nr:CPP1-like family protein [Leptolyngbyaceae bacterium]